MLTRFHCSMAIAMPIEHHCTLRQVRIHHFFPTHQFATLAPHMTVYPSHEVTQQVPFIVQSFFFHPLPAKRTLLPMSIVKGIASYMKKTGREQFHHLIDDMLQKGKHIFITRTIDDTGMFSTQSRHCTYIFIHHRTGQQRICRQGRIAMTRHRNFRNHFYLTIGCISNDLLHVFLRIESTIYQRLPLTGIPTLRKDKSLPIHCFRADRCQQRILLDFQSPAVFVRQMQMQLVQLQHPHRIDDSEQMFLRDKITDHIQHQATITESGFVRHTHGWHLPNGSFPIFISFYFRRKQLTQCLQSIKSTFHPCCPNQNFLWFHFKHIAFFLQSFILLYADIPFLPFLQFRGKSCRLGKQRRKILGYRLHLFILPCYNSLIAEHKASFPLFYSHRIGDQRYRRLRHFLCNQR